MFFYCGIFYTHDKNNRQRKYKYMDRIGKLLVYGIDAVESYEIIFRDGTKTTFDRCRDKNSNI